ncbi:nodulation protein NodN [Sphingobium sp. 22B]|nr:nodulation protein NodN [Sphingobium sp. AM]KYC30768.1 nodulation protein NodN [Sphingobium sp. 22B]OAP30065.1 nodulation protein NodN [Sphingobium sp. 20006FA]
MCTLDELRSMVGQEVGVSDWYLIDQDMVNRFADLTDDHQFHHVDPERARDSPFGTTIAHGMLTLSLLRSMYESSKAPVLDGTSMAVSYGANRLRFTAPVPTGSRVRGHFTLADLNEGDDGRVLQTFTFTVEIEGQSRPALIAEWLIQFVR